MDLNTQTPWGVIRLYQGITRLLEDFPADIVNCHRGESFILWGFLRKYRQNFRLVRTRGDQRLPKANIFNRILHRHVADAVISTNTRMTDHFTTRFHLDPKRLFQIIGGVERSRFFFDPKGRAEIRQEFGYTDQDIVIGLLGRFDLVKGQKETIEAVAKARNRVGSKKIKLMLLGFETDTSEAQVRQWVRENRIEDITVITGKRSDIRACISGLDLGVVSSLWSETIARAALEIMACSIPLVGTTVGVMPDLLQPHALVPPGDVPALADCFARSVNDPGFRQTLRKEQAATMNHLSGQDFLNQTLAIYERLLASRSPS
jgi:glycosyltransferase involved in cell wall biosynthesis